MINPAQSTAQQCEGSNGSDSSNLGIRQGSDEKGSQQSRSSKCDGYDSYYRSQLINTNIAINPLIAAALPILALVTRLEKATLLSDHDVLLTNLTHEIKAFEHKTQIQGYRSNTITTARSALCYMLDEVIKWHEQCNSESFFTLLEQAMQNPADNLDLLELFYLCLNLGYKGQEPKYTEYELTTLMDRLYSIIRQKRGELNKHLLVQDTEAQAKPPKKIHWLRWLTITICSLICLNLILFLSFNFKLNSALDPLNAFAKQHFTFNLGNHT